MCPIAGICQDGILYQLQKKDAPLVHWRRECEGSGKRDEPFVAVDIGVFSRRLEALYLQASMDC